MVESLFPQIASLHVQHIVTVVAHLIDPRGDPLTVDIAQLGDTQIAGHHRGPQLVVPVTQDLIEAVCQPVAAGGMPASTGPVAAPKAKTDEEELAELMAM